MESARKHLQEMPESYFNRETKLIQRQLKYLQGEKAELENWYQESPIEVASGSHNVRLNFINAGIFLAQQQYEKFAQKETYNALHKLYRKKINLTRSMGYILQSADTIIELAYSYLKTNNIQQAQALSKELAIYKLDWWKIDLLNAYLEYQAGNLDIAKKLSLKAKESASQSWNEENQRVLDLVSSK